MSNAQATAASIRAYALEQEGGPYVYGATAEPCTPGMRRQQMRQYPEYADKITENCPVLDGKQSTCEGCPHQGRPAHDCATLTRFAAEAGGLSLPSGATSQWNKGDWAAKGTISTLPGGHVAFVYHRKNGSDSVMSHTGVYLGDGTVVEARGHKDGVVHGSVYNYPWTHWGILRGMPLPEGVAELPPERKTLRKGSRGADVRELQRILRKAGYVLEIDGIFGELTRQAVLTYQGTHGLERDGIVGPMTWGALYAGVPEDAPEETPDAKPQEKTWASMTTEEKVEDLNERMMAVEGGDTHG